MISQLEFQGMGIYVDLLLEVVQLVTPVITNSLPQQAPTNAQPDLIHQFDSPPFCDDTMEPAKGNPGEKE